MLTLNSGACSHGLPHLLVKPTLSFGTSKQVDDLLHLYGSAVDGADPVAALVPGLPQVAWWGEQALTGLGDMASGRILPAL